MEQLGVHKDHKHHHDIKLIYKPCQKNGPRVTGSFDDAAAAEAGNVPESHSFNGGGTRRSDGQYSQVERPS